MGTSPSGWISGTALAGIAVSMQTGWWSRKDAARPGRGPAPSLRLGTRPPGRDRGWTHSARVGQILTSWSHEVLVANPRRLRVVYEKDRKSDRVDAEWLARVARLDARLLAPVPLRSADVRAALAVLQSRDALVRARTPVVNHVHGATTAFGARRSACSTPSFARRALRHLPPDLIGAFAPVLDIVAPLTQVIREFDRQIARLAETGYPATQRLRQVPGVGSVTALTFLLTVDDPSRFPHSRALGSYVGPRPRQHDAGQARAHLRITKTGDLDVRGLLVGCAHNILGPFGPDTHLRRWVSAVAL